MGSAYEGIFTVLDELGMPDLKQVFVQHCIQVRNHVMAGYSCNGQIVWLN